MNFSSRNDLRENVFARQKLAAATISFVRGSNLFFHGPLRGHHPHLRAPVSAPAICPIVPREPIVVSLLCRELNKFDSITKKNELYRGHRRAFSVPQRRLRRSQGRTKKEKGVQHYFVSYVGINPRVTKR